MITLDATQQGIVDSDYKLVSWLFEVFPGSELIVNGTAETGDTTGWDSWFDAGDGAAGSLAATDADKKSGTYSFKVVITGAGDSIEDIQIYTATDSGFAVTTGLIYKLCFAIKGSKAFNGCKVKVQDRTDPWTGYGLSETFNVTTSWVEHEHYFTSTGTDADTRVCIQAGGIDTGDIYFDDVSLKEVRLWSTKDYTYDGQDYEFKVLPSSFKGVTLNRNKSELRIQAPNDLAFSITNPDNTLTAADFVDGTVHLKLVVSDGTDEEIIRQWKFNVKRCESGYQKLSFVCEDFIQQYLEGDYPNTKLVKDVSFSDDPDINDNVCVPVPFGTCYIPLRSIYTSGARHYLLGKTATCATYDIFEVRSPRAWGGKSTWATDNYSFTQSTDTIDGVQWSLFQPIIADSDSDGTPDACGLWRQGDYFLDMPTQFSREVSSAATNPADVIEFVLEDFGVGSGDIDTGASSSFATAASTFSTWGLEYNGVFWYKQPKEKVLAQLLCSCHSSLQVTDKVELYVLSASSVATIDKTKVMRRADVGEGTFRHSLVKTKVSDSGYVAFQEADEPQDEFVKILVPAKASTDEISGEIVEVPFVQDSQDVQRVGTLYYQRKLPKKADVSFIGKGKLLALCPDDVVTVDHADYGGTYDVLVDSMSINRDLSIRFTCTQFSVNLDDWGDLSPAAVTLATDDSTSIWQPVISGPDATASTGQIPNVLKGRLRIGTTGEYILFDPSVPIQEFYESSQLRFRLGDLGSSDFGMQVFDSTGATVMELDGSGNNLLSGWSIDAEKIYKANAHLHSDGFVSFGATPPTSYGTPVGAWFGYDSGAKMSLYSDADNYLQFDASKLLVKAANFELDASGNITASSASLSGTITANAGAIGGWTIATDTISSANVTLDSANDKITVNTIQIDGANNKIESDNYVTGYAGAGFHLSPSLLEVGNIACRGIMRTAVFQKDVESVVGGNLRVRPGDVLDADMVASDTDVGSDLVTGGGFEDAGDISEWAAANDAQLSSVAGGQAGTNCLQIQDNGATANPFCIQEFSIVAGRTYRFTFYVKQGTEATYMAYVRSPDAVKHGVGIDTEATAAWVQHSYIFEADQGGTWSIYLHRRGAAAGTNLLFDTVTLYEITTLKIEGNATFATSDILRIKDGADDEWLEVLSATSATYAVERDKAGDYSVDANPTWKKGAAVVNYGQSGDGGIHMTASDTNAPYLSVFTHAGSPWSASTEHVRLGNLNGYLGYSSDVYGIGIGSSVASDANITFDPTNGIRLRCGTTDKITLANDGTVTIIGEGSGVTNIDGGNIQADTVTATEIAATAITASEIKGTDFGNLTISSGTITFNSSGKLIINVADALEIQAAGDIKVLAGGDIKFYSATGNPSVSEYHGDARSYYMGVDYDRDRFCIFPDTDGTGTFRLGYNFADAGVSFEYINMYADKSIYMQATYNATEIILSLNAFDGLIILSGAGLTIANATAPSPPLANTFYEGNIVKGWIKFNMATGAVADSFNVSSVVDLGGAGTWTINWDRDFANANYVCIVQGSQSSRFGASDTFAVGSCVAHMRDDGGNHQDDTLCQAIAIGDQ